MMQALCSKKRFSVSALAICLNLSNFSYGLNTATIVSSALSQDCIDYRITGICYWLFCAGYKCTVRTSVKVSHYIPDAVVTSYSDTGECSGQAKVDTFILQFS